jgi:hypothetical protein
MIFLQRLGPVSAPGPPRDREVKEASPPASAQKKPPLSSEGSGARAPRPRRSERWGYAMDAKYPLPSPDRRLATSEIEAALKSLLREDKLRLSERNRRFLTFVVTETLAGRARRIKAYTIGVDVFGRGEDFDPDNDPIVRIEATRIRSALSGYYEKFGGREPIRIVIPPGSYVPVFVPDAGPASEGATYRFAPNDNRRAADGERHRPAIVVTIRSALHDSAGASVAAWLKQIVAARLRALKITVFLPPSGERRAIERTLLDQQSAYALDIVVHADKPHHRQSWALIDLGTGELIGSMLEDRSERKSSNVSTIDTIVERACWMIEEALLLDEPSTRAQRIRRGLTSTQLSARSPRATA